MPARSGCSRSRRPSDRRLFRMYRPRRKPACRKCRPRLERDVRARRARRRRSSTSWRKRPQKPPTIRSRASGWKISARVVPPPDRRGPDALAQFRRLRGREMDAGNQRERNSGTKTRSGRATRTLTPRSSLIVANVEAELLAHPEHHDILAQHVTVDALQSLLARIIDDHAPSAPSQDRGPSDRIAAGSRIRRSDDRDRYAAAPRPSIRP